MTERSRISEVKGFLSTAEEEILIISPYMTPSTLAEALSEIPAGVDVTVICSWRTDDLLFGSSKLETYEACQENGWSLRVDHDGMSRTIHLKAYMADGQMAMIGSANMTGRGMRDNIESLIPAPIEAHPTLADAIEESIAGSRPVDNEVYRQFREHISSIPKPEEPEIPLLTVVHGAMELEILRQMPLRPTLDDLLQLPSIRKALPVRGLRFGEIRRILRRNSTRGSAKNTINDRTMELMNRIVESDPRLDIQKRYGTDCLVWKIHHIINKEIRSQLEPYIGRPLRELGLDEPLWDESAYGPTVAKFCLSKLTSEISITISNLRTSDKSLRLGEDGKPLNPTPTGPRIVLTDPEGNFLNMSPELVLPEDKLRDSLWLPSFCIFEAPSGTKMKDVLLLGFGLWESNHKFIQDLESDLHDDIQILGEQELPFTANPFTGHPRKVIFTKIAHGKGNSHLPLGHPDRKMSRYFKPGALTSIAQEILSHDH